MSHARYAPLRRSPRPLARRELAARAGRPWRFPLLAAAALLSTSATAAGQIPVIRAEAFTVDLTGYVRTLTGVHDAGFDTPLGARTSGFHGAVTRLKWTADVPGRVKLVVHDRVLATLTSSGTSPVAGFGVSRTPGRAFDLSSAWVEEERLAVVHDFDRLALTVLTPVADFTVGRQAVSWGISGLFPVADVWAAFSPFELDTEEKPGIDAVRALAYPWTGVEVDAIVADRGDNGVSAGARVTAALDSWELWAGGGRLWNEAMAMAGVTYVFDVTSVRAEAVFARDTDAGETLDPRFTLGADRLGSRFTVSAEYHFNGLGAAQTSEYAGRLLSPPFARGETYYLGRHYLGVVAAWSPDLENRLNLTASALANLTDASLALTPVATYDFGQTARVSVGALISAGDGPIAQSASPLPRLRSEFGSYGDLGFLRVSVYF